MYAHLQYKQHKVPSVPTAPYDNIRTDRTVCCNQIMHVLRTLNQRQTPQTQFSTGALPFINNSPADGALS